MKVSVNEQLTIFIRNGKVLKNYLLYSVSLLLFVGCTSKKSISSQEADIRHVREVSNQAIAARDTALLATTWTSDIHVLSSRNSELNGREANQQALAREFEAGKLFIRTPHSIEVFEKWNMAAEHGEWTGRWTDADGAVEISGTYFAKWHRVNGQWRIRSETFVPLHCNGHPFCEKVPF